MDVVGHDDEGVELNSILASLFLKDVHKEGCVLFDLEEASAICGDRCDEVRAKFLRSSWHGEEGVGLTPPLNVRCGSWG
jgi:hypothetical protein